MKIKEKELISIIIPVYNVEKYLRKCIESIIGQIYNNIEIILVDDGSRDNSGIICDEFLKKDKRIKVFHKENGGVSSARNLGLDNASGKYIIFVDADDYLSNDCVSYMYDLISKTNTDFCFSKYCYKVKSDEQNLDVVEIYTPSQATAYLLSMEIDVGCWNKIYKKDLIDKYNLRFSNELFYGEGLDFITMVSQRANNVGVGSKRVYYYRQNNISSATTYFNIKKYKNGEKSLQEIQRKLILNDKNIKKQLDIHFCMFYVNAITDVLINKQKEKYMLEYKYWLKKIRKLIKKIVFYKELTLKLKIKIMLVSLFPKLILKRKKKNDKMVYNNSID